MRETLLTIHLHRALLCVALCVVCVLHGGNDKQHYKKDLSVACIPGALGEGKKKKKKCY